MLYKIKSLFQKETIYILGAIASIIGLIIIISPLYKKILTPTDRFTAFIEQAKEYFEKGDYIEAKRILEKSKKIKITNELKDLEIKINNKLKISGQKWQKVPQKEGLFTKITRFIKENKSYLYYSIIALLLILISIFFLIRLFKTFLIHYIAIDIGTLNTHIRSAKRGDVFNEPTMVAIEINRSSEELQFYGRKAYNHEGRTPANILIKKPIERGAIADFENLKKMLDLLFRKTGILRYYSRIKFFVGISSGLMQAEKKSYKDILSEVGKDGVILIQKQVAAAIGAELPALEPEGTMIVDIGAGTTEAAIISQGGTVFYKFTRSGGEDMNKSIMKYIKKNIIWQ